MALQEKTVAKKQLIHSREAGAAKVSGFLPALSAALPKQIAPDIIRNNANYCIGATTEVWGGPSI